MPSVKTSLKNQLLSLTASFVLAAVMAMPASAQPGLGLKDGERVNPNVAAQVDQWIEQMESPKAAVRRNAARQLENIGAAAIKPLETLALNGGLEASERAFEILKKHLNGDFPRLSEKSKESLERIAESKDLAKSRIAERMLAPALEETQRPEFRPRAPMQQQQFARRTSVKVSNVNGKRDISVDQDGEKYRFTDGGKGIRVERPDGKGGVKKSEYKDDDAMKKADNEAYQIYKRYANGMGGGGIRIQMGGGFGGGGFPGFPQIGGNQFFQPFGNPQMQPGFPQQQQIQPPRLRPLPPKPNAPKAPAPKNDSDIIEV